MLMRLNSGFGYEDDDEDPRNHWTQCDQGHWHWGRNGAAGMLLRHIDDSGQQRYFMQQRGPDVQHPGTWSTPGGAIEDNETPQGAAMREATEELGQFPVYDLQHLHTLDHGGWAYHTMQADVPHPFYSHGQGWNPNETSDAGWFTPAEIDELPLHPGFREGWDQYKPNAKPDVHRELWSKLDRTSTSFVPLQSSPETDLQFGDRVRTPEGPGRVQEINPEESPVMPVWVQLNRGYHDWYHPEELQRIGAATLPWKLGYPGKGIVTPTGNVYKWSVFPDPADPNRQPHDGDPSHHVIVQRMGYDRNEALQSQLHYFSVNPDGSLRFVVDDDGENSPPEMVQHVLNSHPDFKLPAEPMPGLSMQAAQFVHRVPEQEGSTEPQEVNNPEDHWPDWGETPPNKPSGTHTDYDWAYTRI